MPEEWEACAGEVDADALAGQPCWAGLDLSATRDLTACVLYFPEDDGAVAAKFWVPKDGLAMKEAEDYVPYRAWIREGYVTATVGAAINKRAVALDLAEAAQTYDIKGIACDRWGMPELRRILAEEGIELPLEDWGQGYKDMGPAVSAFEALLADRQINHGSNPVLRWQSRNLVFETDPAGNRNPSKNRATERIDGMVVLIMACGLHASLPQIENNNIPIILAV